MNNVSYFDILIKKKFCKPKEILRVAGLEFPPASGLQSLLSKKEKKKSLKISLAL